MTHINTIICVFCLNFLAFVNAFAAEELTFNIRGVNAEITKNIQARLDIVEGSFGKPLTQQHIQEIYQQSPAQIRTALEPYGYFNSKIKSNLRHYQNVWEANFSIEPGVPLKISALKISVSGEGKNNFELNKFINNFPLAKGQVFKAVEYSNAKENFFEIANNQGYIKAHFENNKILINPKTNTAIITISLHTGPRYYFGKVTFASSPYASYFLQRFVNFKEGQPFSSQTLIQFQQEMNSAANFQQVIATPDFSHAENYRVPITVHVQAPKSQKYNVGIGYGTLTGLRVSAGMSLRRITATGHHFDGQLRWSSVVSGFAAKYYIPGKNPLVDQWTFGANLQSFTPKHASSHGTTISAGYETKYFNIKNVNTLNYLWERYRVFDSVKRTSNMLYPSLSWHYVSADNLITPHFGKSASVTLQGALQKLLSQTTFAQIEVKGKYIFMPLDFSRIIIKGNLGYTYVDERKNLPASLRFYTGGLSGVRGYPDSSIGPGIYLATGSLEYQHRIWGDVYGGVFYDVGNATNKIGNIKTDLFRGTGVGLIYDSMLGPVKFYVAKALTDNKHPYSFEFSIGPEF